MSELPQTGFIRQKDILGILPFSRATLWRKSKDGTFPRPIKLSTRVTVWRAEEVKSWLAEREAEA